MAKTRSRPSKQNKARKDTVMARQAGQGNRRQNRKKPRQKKIIYGETETISGRPMIR
jgi:hypothetical protein